MLDSDLTVAYRDSSALVHIAARVPKALHHELKLRCVRADTSIMDFVIDAIRMRLERKLARGRARARR